MGIFVRSRYVRRATDDARDDFCALPVSRPIRSTTPSGGLPRLPTQQSHTAIRRANPDAGPDHVFVADGPAAVTLYDAVERGQSSLAPRRATIIEQRDSAIEFSDS